MCDPERALSASPNWYCSRCSDAAGGLLGFGARNSIFLLRISPEEPGFYGELVGHTERVSGFAFSHCSGLTHLCASSSDDGTVKVWDTQTRTVVTEHKLHRSTISALHWSPLVKGLLVTGDEKGIVVCFWSNRNEGQQFFPEPRTIFCLSCSPHQEDLVAVGYKDGMVVIIDISRRGDVVHRLRGHDEEIHCLAWCPQLREEDLKLEDMSGEEMNATDGELLPESENKVCYLASGSKDQTVRIWNSSSGKVIMTLKMPHLKRRGGGLDPAVKDRLWATLHWPHGRPTQILCSCFGGELLLWDLTKSGKQKWTILGSSDGQNHSRIVFNLCSLITEEGRELLLSTSMDRELSWHPTKEGRLAFGTDDGKVGIYEVYSNKSPQISSTYHKKTVYSLSWGPPLPPVSHAADGDKPAFTLYSCGGEGLIYQHNPWKLNAEAHDLNKLIRDTNGIQHKMPAHTELNWRADWEHLAVGNEDGSIEIFRAPRMQLICTIQQHHKLINALRWHHNHGEDSKLSFLLASGSNNAVIYIHNLKCMLESPSDAPVTIIEPFRSLSGHTARITSLSWSPHHDARLVSSSYDGTAQVWDVLQEEPLSNYRGHKGRLLCVQWSDLEPDQVWTGADDFSVHRWSVCKQEHSRPPKGKKSIDLEKKRTVQLKPKPKKKRTDSPKLDAAGELVSGDPESPSCAQNGTSDQEDDHISSDQTTLEKTPMEASSEIPAQPILPSSPALVDHSPSPPPRNIPSRRDRPDLSSRKKKSRSLLPLSTSKDHRSKEDQHRDCVKLAKALCAKDLKQGSHAALEEDVHLGLYSDRSTLYHLLEEEGKAHLESGHPELQHQIMLWKGDLKGTLQLASERGELTDQLVAVAPMAGYKVWMWCVEAFVKQLCFEEQYLKAAFHLLSINKIYEAVQLLRGNHLFREAIAVAKSRLLPEDPVIREVYTAWAAVLEQDGHYSMAAKCYLGASSSYDAAKVLAKKGDLLSLSTAAELALIAGEKDLAASFALRCAQEYVTSKNWVEAQQVLDQHHSLLGQRLVFCTSELLYNILEEKAPVEWKTQSTACFHDWVKSISEGSFITKLTGIWQNELGLNTTDQYAECYRQLRAQETPQTTANTNAKQLLLQLSHEMTLSVLCFLTKKWDEVGPALLGILKRCHQSGHFTLMQEVSRLMLADGYIELRNNISPENQQNMAACDSLQAFLAYIKLYEVWWEHANSLSSKPAGMELVMDTPSGSSENLQTSGLDPTLDNMLDFGVLLSELHAAFQRAQRDIAEVQTALRDMIQQHQRIRQIQDNSLELEQDTNMSQDKASDSQSQISSGPSPLSLAELMKKLSVANHKLAEFPEYLKVLPFPDVLESCLVLLHLPLDNLSPKIRAQALSLLTSHSSGSNDHEKAAVKFLSS
uniref:Gem nuclear organelle associated protein 5 n=1 Tax=Leptobrachium leishanense TaxID=445787 RepID=A0A8C5M8N3_9ANUR